MENPFKSINLAINPFKAVMQQISPRYLGVDIGTTSIKMVEVDQGDKPRLANYALLETVNSFNRPNAAFQTSSLKLFESEMSDLLRSMVSKMKPSTLDVVASLSPFNVFTTVISLPKMTDQELKRAISFQARQYVPIPMNEAAVEPIRVGGYEDENGFKFDQVLLITVPLEHIRKYQKIFKDAGLNLRVLEIEGMSLARSLIGTDPTPTLVVDIGSRSTTIVMAEEGIMRFMTQTDFAGSSLTQALASSMNINPIRAEELKKQKGIIGTGPDYELSTVMVPFVDAILNEVKRAQFNYESQFPSARKLERIILAGGGANLLGIEKYVTDQMGVPAVKAAPLNQFQYDPALEPLCNELNPMLSVALGLTLREF